MSGDYSGLPAATMEIKISREKNFPERNSSFHYNSG